MILLTVGISGCQNLSGIKPPKKVPDLYQPNTNKQTVKRYVFQKGSYKGERDEKGEPVLYPLETVNGFFCISPKAYQDIQNYIIEVTTSYQCRKVK